MAVAKVRKKNQNKKRDRISAIKYVVNSIVGKYYMIGDEFTLPSSFNFSELYMKLKGEDLIIAKKLIVDFLFGEPRDWCLMVYHFFQYDDFVEAVPVECLITGVTMSGGADSITELGIKTRDMLFESEEYSSLKSNYLSYGYYYSWINEDGLNFDKMDQEIILGLIKVSKDFSQLDRQKVLVNGFDIVDQVAKEKFSITAKDGMKTGYIEITEALKASLLPANLEGN
ncbi:hypothetical protein [Aeromonas phage AerS_266]|nr:hypothetical protein [Aeromonas phage AerS_266]